jgi:hypothetical protein
VLSDRFISLDTVTRQRIELGFTQDFWKNVTFIVLLIAILSVCVAYGVSITAAA